MDGEEPQGDWKWEQAGEEQLAGSIESVGNEKVNVEEDGYETVRRSGPRPRTLGQHMPEIFAVDTEAVR